MSIHHLPIICCQMASPIYSHRTTFAAKHAAKRTRSNARVKLPNTSHQKILHQKRRRTRNTFSPKIRPSRIGVESLEGGSDLLLGADHLLPSLLPPEALVVVRAVVLLGQAVQLAEDVIAFAPTQF